MLETSIIDNGPKKLRTQYATSTNLDARLALHERFSRHPQGWHPWVFDQYDFASEYRILELGCGAAYQWKGENRERIDATWRVTLTDYSMGMLTTAREATLDLGFTYANINAMALPYPDDSFDRVIANHMLYHVPDRPVAFREIARVLRPGGKLFAGTNSVTSMAGLGELTKQAEPEAFEKGGARPFTLENGSDQLSPWFADVHIEPYDDGLDITEIDPLVDYVRSADRMSEAGLARFADITRSILEHKGVISIDKRGCLFICTV
jgi:ubiquinone/menaquinone biosynthesis C-methylase UbiE